MGEFERVVESRVVRLVVVGLCVLLVGFAWAMSSPVGSSPDDDFHLPSIWCAPTAPSSGCSDLGPSSRDGFRRVEVASGLGPEVACYHYQMFESGACQKLAEPTVVETNANDDLYPGGYYWIMGPFARGGIAQSVVVMRLVNFVICAVLLVGAIALSPRAIRRSAIVGMAATSIPMGLFLWSSTNPSGLVIAAVPATWILWQSLVADSDRRTRIARVTLLAIASLLALVSRSDAGVYLVVTAVAVALSLPREKARRLLSHRVTLALVIVTAAFIALALIARFPNAGIGIGMQKVDYDRSLQEVFFYNFVNLPLMWTGGLGSQGLGWLDTPIPVLVTFVTIPFFVLMVASGLRSGTVGSRRATVWIAGVLFVIPFYVMAMDRSLVGEIFQARYLLPLLPVLVMSALASSGFAQSSFTGRGSLRGGAIVLSLAHAVALHANMRRYVTGVEVRTFDLDAGREWWWPWGPSANAVWLIGTLGFAAVCWAAVRWLEAGELAPRH